MSTDDVNDSVREEFSKLSLDGKTSFLVEAIFSTAGSAINEIGSRLNGLVTLVTEPFGSSGNGSEADTAAQDPSKESETETDSTKGEATSAGSRSGKTRKGGSKEK
jgi:hypothetical protein